jgi:hypothetical protein
VLLLSKRDQDTADKNNKRSNICSRNSGTHKDAVL